MRLVGCVYVQCWCGWDLKARELLSPLSLKCLLHFCLMFFSMIPLVALNQQPKNHSFTSLICLQIAIKNTLYHTAFYVLDNVVKPLATNTQYLSKILHVTSFLYIC